MSDTFTDSTDIIRVVTALNDAKLDIHSRNVHPVTDPVINLAWDLGFDQTAGELAELQDRWMLGHSVDMVRACIADLALRVYGGLR